MSKPHVTRTYGQIHFEDLDPHRFEDLVRELIYDFKDWYRIEATGRSGADEGFDVRAYEKKDVSAESERDDDREEEIQSMEGNLWMIQGKREKAIGPERLKSIISEVDKRNPPYGYILAASSNFSKKSYDVFRDELRKKGVTEFYLWGKAELEDMLHLPKNDRVLFTFFGISLVSKRRSRTTEVRAPVIIKNKLYKCVGEKNRFLQSVLIRDLKDTHYPFKDKYRDFKKKPRWREYVAFGHHPLGLWCHSHEYFAFVDTKKKEWDFTPEVDLVARHIEHHMEGRDAREKEDEKRELVRDFWEFFPRANQAYFLIDGAVKYSDISLVDDKGDVLYDCPHIYVDYVDSTGRFGPFAGSSEYFKIGPREISLTDEYKRVKLFPKTFQRTKFGKIHKHKKVMFNTEMLEEFKKYRVNVIYEPNNTYNFLNPKDVISVANSADNSKGETHDDYIQITHKFKERIKDFVKEASNAYEVERIIRLQLGRDFSDNERINIYEFRRVYGGQFEETTK